MLMAGFGVTTGFTAGACVEAVKSTVVKALGVSAIPCWLVSKLVAVPGCTLCARAAPLSLWGAAVWGFCVVVCPPPELVVVVSGPAISLL